MNVIPHLTTYNRHFGQGEENLTHLTLLVIVCIPEITTQETLVGSRYKLFFMCTVH